MWVKVVEFFDTVAPTIHGTPATMVHNDNEVNQYIDITFTKPLILQHVNVSDFTVIIDDVRTNTSSLEDGTNDISDQMDYIGTISVTPLKVETKNGNGLTGAMKQNADETITSDDVLRLTLPGMWAMARTT